MSKRPWWVGPSLAERPARSMQKRTLRFWRQMSWTMGSKARWRKVE